MTRRPLRPDERAIWQKVAATARARRPPPLPEPAPVPDAAVPAPPLPRLGPFRIGETAPPVPQRLDLPLAPSDRLAAQPVVMDAKLHRAMARGRLHPEARIDLHGMTQAEAHPALTGFILASQAMGRRLVLVITGKGDRQRDPGQGYARHSGVLRHQVPHWLTLPPLRAAVMQVTVAHARHGGEGAYYVYLRRPRG